MTNEEKSLLLKDLCSRLPYKVKVHIKNNNGTEIDDELTISTIKYFNEWEVKPYLKPISALTKNDEHDLDELALGFYTSDNIFQLIPDIDTYDWLYEHHFDFRELIEKGLALNLLDYKE